MNVLFLSFDYLTQPLGVAGLSATLRAAGHTTEVAALGDTARQEALLSEFKPRLLCFTLITGQHILFLERARQIKKAYPHIIVAAGGPHATFYPDCIEEPCLDAICRGEGDIALPSFVRILEERGRPPEESVNWWIKQADGSISRSDVSPLIADLDSLPFADRSIFDRALPGEPPPALYVMTSRGCPFNCAYCFNHAYRDLYKGLGAVCRRRSVGNVLEEINGLKGRYPLQMVVFQDDTFNLDREWLREFAPRYAREVGLPFHCHLRADLMDGEVADLLSEGGCISVKLGLEAARSRVRRGILRRGMTLAQFKEACKLLHERGIRFATENILATPGTTLDEDLFTYAVNKRVRPAHSFASLMQVYPGTDMADYAVRYGFSAGPVRDFPSTFYEDSVIRITDKKQRGRLRALFAVSVSMRIPTAVVRLLIRVPARGLYEGIDRLWKGYCLRFRIYPYRQGIKSFVRDLCTYLRGKYY